MFLLVPLPVFLILVFGFIPGSIVVTTCAKDIYNSVSRNQYSEVFGALFFWLAVLAVYCLVYRLLASCISGLVRKLRSSGVRRVAQLLIICAMFTISFQPTYLPVTTGEAQFGNFITVLEASLRVRQL